jgi:predicted nucleic-acid-binding protein
MLALDTNVLIRYLAQDDARQSALATEWIEQRLSAAEPAFISLVTLLETVWVMETWTFTTA